MWKEIALILIGLVAGIPFGVWWQGKILNPLIGDDFEINRPKVKGEDNILQVFQSNKKDTTKEDITTEKKRRRIFKRKNK